MKSKYEDSDEEEPVPPPVVKRVWFKENLANKLSPSNADIKSHDMDNTASSQVEDEKNCWQERTPFDQVIENITNDGEASDYSVHKDLGCRDESKITLKSSLSIQSSNTYPSPVHDPAAGTVLTQAKSTLSSDPVMTSTATSSLESASMLQNEEHIQSSQSHTRPLISFQVKSSVPKGIFRAVGFKGSKSESPSHDVEAQKGQTISKPTFQQKSSSSSSETFPPSATISVISRPQAAQSPSGISSYSVTTSTANNNNNYSLKSAAVVTLSSVPTATSVIKTIYSSANQNQMTSYSKMVTSSSSSLSSSSSSGALIQKGQFVDEVKLHHRHHQKLHQKSQHSFPDQRRNVSDVSTRTRTSSPNTHSLSIDDMSSTSSPKSASNMKDTSNAYQRNYLTMEVRT